MEKPYNKDLLKCPFCGHKAKFYQDNYNKQWFIQCTRCGIRTLTSYEKENVLSAWNRRAEV